jgi:ATP-dependent HslUV protease subunit HslV
MEAVGLFKATTIVAVKDGKKAAIAGDGQVTFGESTIMKHTARKVRRIFNDRVLVGFAGSVADALTLSDKFEEKLEQHSGNLQRAAVELAQDWRMDKVMRKLEALMIALNEDYILIISGNGEVIEPDDGIASIGSGGMYALAAARALKENTDLSPADIVKKALKTASSICVYTNDNIIVEEL